jgi:hypothetical protein
MIVVVTPLNNSCQAPPFGHTQKTKKILVLCKNTLMKKEVK